MKNLLLLHGALGHSDQFAPYTEALSAQFKVHTPLFSGHGGIALPEGGITMEQYTKELAEYCRREQLQDVHIFGHSMGGYVGLCLAAETPGLVHSVMTLGTKFDWTEEGALKESKMLDPQAIQAKVPQYATLLESQHGPQWQALLPAIAGMMINLGKKPLLQQDHLAAITCPVQIMIGDRDNMVSLEESAAVYRALPNARMAVLPGTKHPMDRVDPKQVLQLMTDFWSLS